MLRAELVRDCSIIILAAGRGSRLGMGAKPLVKIHGTPLIQPILENALAIDFDTRIVVVSNYTEEISRVYPDKNLEYLHTEPKGTGGNTAEALEKINTKFTVVAQADDSFFLRKETLINLIANHIASGCVATLAISRLDREASYAWVEHREERLIAIHGSKDDLNHPPPKDIAAGLYVFTTDWLRQALNTVSQNERTGEKPLPGVFRNAKANAEAIAVFMVPKNQWFGINTPDEYTEALTLAA